jgi:hypothetical protein
MSTKQKFTIPEIFKVFGYTIHVIWDKSLEDRTPPDWGEADLTKGTIRLNPKLEHESEALRLHVYLHELTHIILDAFRPDLSADEAFVETFSGLLAQALDSSRGSALLDAWRVYKGTTPAHKFDPAVASVTRWDIDCVGLPPLQSFESVLAHTECRRAVKDTPKKSFDNCEGAD